MCLIVLISNRVAGQVLCDSRDKLNDHPTFLQNGQKPGQTIRLALIVNFAVLDVEQLVLKRE